MDRPKLNFIIDIIMFVLLAAIAGIGLLMNYILLPGREAQVAYGRRVDLYLFGLDRHQWGDIHFYLALTMLAFLALHIYLHWSIIVGLFQRVIPNPKTRSIALWIFIIVCLILIYFPFLFSPQVEDRGRGSGRGRGWRQGATEMVKPVANLAEPTRQTLVRGFRAMVIAEWPKSSSRLDRAASTS
ncbi:MAG: DUF4405 domain-containing protein [Deltaproteobacteria bacterium]|nr:DUF4405 domain-containing protein [Deltaproteobacteria bacterium]